MSGVGVGQEEALSHSRIFRFFAPLALSWIFMSIEGPVCVGLISRLPNAKVGTAALQIMMGLALWIESPVIDLLSTSTTLAKHRQSYLALQRFVTGLLVLVTVAHAAIVFSPLYWIVTERLMGVPHDVADAARIGLAWMVLWSAFIGWRRFLQGILIRAGQTKVIGVGTAVRVVAMVVAAAVLYGITPLSGMEIAGISLVLAVAAEAGFIHWASRDAVRTVASRHDESAEPISTGKLLRFHLPLTATTMVIMIGSPIVASALARTQDSVTQLAAYQVAITLVWLMRTTVYALPEVVIALYRDRESAETLRRFCLLVGLVTSGSMALIWALGVDRLYFRHVLGAQAELIPLAHIAFIAAVLTPLVGALQSYVRGMLTAHHLTTSRFIAVGVSMVTLVCALALAEVMGKAGVLAAGICLTAALVAELAILLYFWRRGNSDGAERKAALAV